MSQYITVTSGKYGTIKFEVDSSETAQNFNELSISKPKITGAVEKLSLKKNVQNAVEQTTDVAEKIFDQIKNNILALSEEFKDVMKQAAPDEASLEFSLTVKADAGVMIAKAGAESALKVNLTWKRKDNKDASNV